MIGSPCEIKCFKCGCLPCENDCFSKTKKHLDNLLPVWVNSLSMNSCTYFVILASSCEFTYTLTIGFFILALWSV